MNINNTKIKLLIFCLLLLGGFLVRLYRFDGPVADWHSWRQADTSAVSRNFVSSGFDLLHPKFDDLSNVPSGIFDNPNGYRFVEFPIYNVFQAGFFKLIGYFTIEEWGRLVTIFFSLVSSIFLFLLVKKRADYLTGLLAAFFMTFLPFNIFYDRTILPDPMMVSFILGAIYYFDLWISKDKNLKIYDLKFITALIFSVGAFLIKPFAVFFMLPMVFLVYEKYGFSFVKKWQLWSFAIISLVPFGLWRMWIQQYPSGIPQSLWLLNGNNIRFRPSFFNWIFIKRIGELILGYWGVGLFALGFLQKNSKNYLYFLSFFVSSIIYVTVVATGNVQHSYYQIPIIPSIAIFLAFGGTYLLKPTKELIPKKITIVLFVVFTVLMFYFGWLQARDYFNINDRSIVIAGVAVDKLIPKNAKVIAPYDGDTSFLYQTKRKGWASLEKPLPQLIQMGADYLVLVNPKPQDLEIGKTYKIVASNSDYILFDLHQKP